ncbi:MAG TPA: hypothetical protein VM914_12775 [Pyrinomonadaceae bacterium]|jgi:hypothetical protein|nr:hypothetical protein [Pyrinomonadaceae bacterium]
MSTLTTSSRRRAVWALCGLLCATLLLCASFVPGGESSARTATPTRDPSLFYCPYENAYVSFDWTTPKPYGGWLGATGYYKAKDVQAYDAQSLPNGGLNWGFQAQDGSFVCRMYVSSDQNNITFVNCKPFSNWSLTSCFAIY